MCNENRPSLFRVITRSALVGTLAGVSIVAGRSLIQKMNEGLCLGGNYAYGSAASLDTEGNVNLITLRRRVEIIPDPEGQTYKNYLEKVGDTVFEPVTTMKAGEWKKIRAVSNEIMSGFSPIVVNSRTPQPNQPFGKELISCVDKYGNVHYKNR